jgi:uncharacterized protein
MVVGVVTFELHLPFSRSLKEKRKVVKSVIDRLHQKFRVSVMESGFHDLHQRSEVGLALVAKGESDAARKLDELRRAVEEQGEAMVTLWEERILEAVE